MLKRLICLIVLGVICLEFASGTFTVTPSEVSSGGVIDVYINDENYGTNVYLYRGNESNLKGLVQTFDLNCGEDVCSGEKGFSHTIPVNTPLDFYSFSFYSYKDNIWLFKTFEVVGGAGSNVTTEQAGCTSNPGSKGYCDIEYQGFCENSSCSECSCLPSCTTKCTALGKNVNYCKGSATCSCSLLNKCGGTLPVTKQNCSDGTLTGQCSINKPKYCDNGILKTNCTKCGCPISLSCQANGSCANLTCSDGTEVGNCSATKPKYCNSKKELIDNCGSCECSSNQICQDFKSCVNLPAISSNTKFSALYSDKEVFLVSDKNWKEVLQFVPVAVWTQGNEIKKYPFLIYQGEGYSLEDSTKHFIQDYAPSKVTIIGNSSVGLNSLLVAAPDVGVGLTEDKIQKMSSKNYLKYWESFDTLVYVEDNYELALLASTYASLINAPLIIKGTEHDSSNIFYGRDVICAGDVSPAGSYCSEKYNLEQLQQKYYEKTNTNKIILVNVKDQIINSTLEIPPESADYSFSPASPIFPTSLSAPILASAKHEIILSVNQDLNEEKPSARWWGDDGKVTVASYKQIDRLLEPKIKQFNPKYLTIIADFYSIPHSINHLDYTFGVEGFWWALDPSYYADSNGDHLPDFAVGRIAATSLSTVSSYIARDLFYNDFPKTNNMKFLALPFGPPPPVLENLAQGLAQNFKVAGYNSIAKVSHDDVKPSEWENQDLIFYTDHGSQSWAGISSGQIPKLKNSLVVIAACLTASDYDGFWEGAIAKGAIGFFGAVSVTFLSTDYVTILDKIYYENKETIGDAFKESYSATIFNRMTTLIGDPTIEIKPEHRLPEKLKTIDLILCVKSGNLCILDAQCCVGDRCDGFSCQACRTAGTRVGLLEWGKCCTKTTTWVTKSSPNFCCWAAGWDFGCWWNAAHCGTHEVNDYQVCT